MNKVRLMRYSVLYGNNYNRQFEKYKTWDILTVTCNNINISVLSKVAIETQILYSNHFNLF